MFLCFFLLFIYHIVYYFYFNYTHITYSLPKNCDAFKFSSVSLDWIGLQ